MQVALTTLSNELYAASRLQLIKSAEEFGISKTIPYDFEQIKGTAFYKLHKSILDGKKGMGFWLWKPYIIFEELNKLDEGDILIYADAGSSLIASLDPLIEICKHQHPILLFANGNLKNRYWVKRDCFVLMNCDEKKYWNGAQCDAALTIFRKSEVTMGFVKEWLKYCTVPAIITDLPNESGKKNFWGFHFHRMDQSILSLLAIRHQIELFRQPSQYGNHYKVPAFRIKGEFNCISQWKTKQVSFYSSHPFVHAEYYQLIDHHRSQSPSLSSTKKKNTYSIKRRIKKIRRFLLRN
ncbi:MAG: hypothetical protein JSS98_05240 [Bacteroidetes bacterium]|nr:hypothetical protein [Bacteroidota bacterium]